MDGIPLSEAKARLSELADRAGAGETVTITRRGKPPVQLTAVGAPRKPIDIEALRRVRALGAYQEEGAGEFLSRLRDEEQHG